MIKTIIYLGRSEALRNSPLAEFQGFFPFFKYIIKITYFAVALRDYQNVSREGHHVRRFSKNLSEQSFDSIPINGVANFLTDRNAQTSLSRFPNQKIEDKILREKARSILSSKEKINFPQ